MISPSANPAALEQEIAAIDEQIAETKPVDDLLIELRDRRSELRTVEARIATLDYACERPCIAILKHQIEELTDERNSAPDRIELLANSLSRIEAAIHGNTRSLAAHHDQMDGLELFIEHAPQKIESTKRKLAELEREKKRVEKTRDALVSEIRRIETVFKKEGKEDAAAWS